MSERDGWRIFAEVVAEFTGLELLRLVAIVGRELLERGDPRAAEFLSRAAEAHAAFITGPESPSDNGAQGNADSGGAGQG